MTKAQGSSYDLIALEENDIQLALKALYQRRETEVEFPSNATHQNCPLLLTLDSTVQFINNLQPRPTTIFTQLKKSWMNDYLSADLLTGLSVLLDLFLLGRNSYREHQPWTSA